MARPKSPPTSHICKKCNNTFYTRPSKKQEFCSNICAQQYKGINKDWLDRRKNTCLEKYGNEIAFKSKQVQDKYKENLIKKYGVYNPFLVKEFKEKAKATIIQRYNVDVAIKNQDIKNKVSKALKNKPKNRINFIEIKWDKILIYCKEVNMEPLFNKEDLNKKLTFYENNKFEFKCKDCHNITKVSLSNGYLPSCKCTEFRGYSLVEEDIYNFLLENISSEIHIKNKDILPNRLELDIYIPDLSKAIEVNGIYWHSESMGKYRDYHLYKTLKCLEKNIQLIHIFDNEWLFKKPIIQSILRSKFNLIQNKIYARKCEIREIKDSKILREFLNTNHIQGYCYSKWNYGLFYKDELVAVMTFNKNRFKKNSNELELVRFCNKLNTNVIGGASKLFQYFIRNKTNIGDEIISFADRRFSVGHLYYNLGFDFLGNIPPSYFYWKNNIVLKRMSCQKHKLFKLLEKFDVNKTEYENMLNNGYKRVWDCGNIKFKYIVK